MDNKVILWWTIKRIFNKLYDDKMKKENDKMKMEKARANKEIDND